MASSVDTALLVKEPKMNRINLNHLAFKSKSQFTTCGIPQMTQIALVANQHNYNIGIRMVAHFLQPVGTMVQLLHLIAILQEVNRKKQEKTYHRSQLSKLACLEIS
jgi:hypothetical protein